MAGRVAPLGWRLSPLAGCSANTWDDLWALGSRPAAPPCPATPHSTWQLQPLGHLAQTPPHWLGRPRAGLRGAHCPFFSSWLQLNGHRVRGWWRGWGSSSPGHGPENKGRGARWWALWQRALPTLCGHSPGHQHVSCRRGNGVFQQRGLQVDACRRPSLPSGHREWGAPAYCCSALGGGVTQPEAPRRRVWGIGATGLPPRPEVPCSGASDELGCTARGWSAAVGRGGPHPPVGSSGPKCTRAAGKRFACREDRGELRDQVGTVEDGREGRTALPCWPHGCCTHKVQGSAEGYGPTRPLPPCSPLPSFTYSSSGTNPSASQAKASDHRILGPAPNTS